MLALGDRLAGAGDAFREVGVEQAELAVDLGGSGLDPAQPADDRDRDRLARDREVVDGFGGLATPELLSQNKPFVEDLWGHGGYCSAATDPRVAEVCLG